MTVPARSWRAIQLLHQLSGLRCSEEMTGARASGRHREYTEESSPFFALQREVDLKLYPGNYSRKNTIGDRRIVLTTTPEKMKTIQNKYYVPNNSVLIVSGDVNPVTVFSLAERELGAWSRGADPFVTDPIPSIPPLQKSEGVVVEAPVGR